MKSRDELLTEIFESDSVEDAETLAYSAVNFTIDAVLEYIDDVGEQWGHYEVLGQVLTVLRANVKQLGSNG